MSNATNINATDFDQQVLENPKFVLVDFWAEWCGPCRAMAPILDQLSSDADLQDKLQVSKMDIEFGNNRDIAMQYNVISIPNMKLFKDGKVVAEYIGLRSFEDMKKALLADISKE